MTPSELKWKVEQSGDSPYFFSRETMRFFGDRMSNYGVRDGGRVTTNMDEVVEVWELWRKRPVRHGLQNSHYFRKDNFHEVFLKRD